VHSLHRWRGLPSCARWRCGDQLLVRDISTLDTAPGGDTAQRACGQNRGASPTRSGELLLPSLPGRFEFSNTERVGQARWPRRQCLAGSWLPVLWALERAFAGRRTEEPAEVGAGNRSVPDDLDESVTEGRRDRSRRPILTSGEQSDLAACPGGGGAPLQQSWSERAAVSRWPSTDVRRRSARRRCASSLTTGHFAQLEESAGVSHASRTLGPMHPRDLPLLRPVTALGEARGELRGSHRFHPRSVFLSLFTSGHDPLPYLGAWWRAGREASGSACCWTARSRGPAPMLPSSSPGAGTRALLKRKPGEPSGCRSVGKRAVRVPGIVRSQQPLRALQGETLLHWLRARSGRSC